MTYYVGVLDSATDSECCIFLNIFISKLANPKANFSFASQSIIINRNVRSDTQKNDNTPP